MKYLAKCVSALAVVVLLSGSAIAANTLAAGKVKSVNAEGKEFILTDGADKDWTIKFGDDVVINRGGKESNSDLKAGDAISVCYAKGLRTWTAHYILVKEGDTKDSQLAQGSFKSYDADKKSFTYTDAEGKSTSYDTGDAKVRLNMQQSAIENMKVGDTVLIVVDQNGDKSTLKHVMAGRSK